MTDQSPGQRAAAYWFIDGLPDIVLGLTLLVFGGGALLWQIAAPHHPILDLLIVAAGLTLHFFIDRRVLGFLKSRTTYPRTGYVQPPEEAQAQCEITTLNLDPAPRSENVSHYTRRTVMLTYFVLYNSFGFRRPNGWFAPFMLVTLAVALYVANRRSEHPWPWWWALVLAASGIIFLVADVPYRLQPLESCLIVGVWMAAYGLATLVRYRYTNPLAEQLQRS